MTGLGHPGGEVSDRAERARREINRRVQLVKKVLELVEAAKAIAAKAPQLTPEVKQIEDKVLMAHLLDPRRLEALIHELELAIELLEKEEKEALLLDARKAFEMICQLSESRKKRTQTIELSSSFKPV